jgi:hypothetical protein
VLLPQIHMDMHVRIEIREREGERESYTLHQKAGPLGCERRRSVDCSLRDLRSDCNELGSRDVIEHEGSRTC